YKTLSVKATRTIPPPFITNKTVAWQSPKEIARVATEQACIRYEQLLRQQKAKPTLLKIL
ncbi:MAG: hypothetical protein ACT6UC_25975, partial [Hydrogenophaga sp.]